MYLAALPPTAPPNLVARGRLSDPHLRLFPATAAPVVFYAQRMPTAAGPVLRFQQWTPAGTVPLGPPVPLAPPDVVGFSPALAGDGQAVAVHNEAGSLNLVRTAATVPLFTSATWALPQCSFCAHDDQPLHYNSTDLGEQASWLHAVGGRAGLWAAGVTGSIFAACEARDCRNEVVLDIVPRTLRLRDLGPGGREWVLPTRVSSFATFNEDGQLALDSDDAGLVYLAFHNGWYVHLAVLDPLGF